MGKAKSGNSNVLKVVSIVAAIVVAVGIIAVFVAPLYQPFQSRLWGSCFDCILIFLWPAQHILRGFLSFHYKNGINLIMSSYFAYFLFMIGSR